MSFAVTVLGSSGMFPTTERAASGYLFERDGKSIWMDAGAGTWRNLIGFVSYADLDGVLLTHRHPDHTSDVFMAVHARLLGQAEPLPPIPLWAPAETIERLVHFYNKELNECFDLREIGEGDKLEIAGAQIAFVRMVHPPMTLGVRISDPEGVLAYSADTGPTADLAQLASGASMFICEATLQDSDELWEGHLSASQAGATAAANDVDQLVLTHLPPARDYGLSLAEAQRTCGDSGVRLATDGLRLEVG